MTGRWSLSSGPFTLFEDDGKDLSERRRIRGSISELERELHSLNIDRNAVEDTIRKGVAKLEDLEKSLEDTKRKLDDYKVFNDYSKLVEDSRDLARRIQNQKRTLEHETHTYNAMRCKTSKLQKQSECISGLLEILRRDVYVHCPICYEDKLTIDNIHVTTCGHLFCQPCVTRWYASSRTRTCPICRDGNDNMDTVNLDDDTDDDSAVD
jgi:predicted DNA-binding protein YlxM (UPF0122 family)